MKLTATNSIAYAKSIGLTNVSIQNIRNMRHLCVTISSDQGDFLIKQKGSNEQLFGNVSLTNELLFYKHLYYENTTLKEITPAVYHIDFEHEIVVIAFVKDAEVFTLKKGLEGNNTLIEKLAFHVATLHTTPLDSTFSKINPAVHVRAHDRVTPEVFAAGGPMYPKFLEMMQRYPEFNEAIHALRSEIMYDTLIHGDLKYDNILVSETTEGKDVKIIDWELIGIGDRYMDLGYMIGNFLLCSIDDIEFKDNSLHFPEDTLDFLQDTIATFLEAYHTRYTKTRIDYDKLSKFTSLYLLNQFYSASLFKNEFSRQDIYKVKLAKTLLMNPKALQDTLYMKSILNSYAAIF